MTNYAQRAFSFAGPYAWNSLPENVRQSPSVAAFKQDIFVPADIAFSALETIYC